MPVTHHISGQSTTASPLPLRTLIDELIAQQQTLQTPVARFAEVHDRQPDLADHYRSLIPLSRPGDGEQYAFEVALDRCTGCKACVSACHSLNGLDDHESWRDTGTMLGGREAPGWQQTVTSACHHCEDPGCLNGCPVVAYEKDHSTGIVRHLDDQCIGCSYCILMCPYDVPKYSKKRGIVRKCDMCHQRLADGEAPACVQACPTEAIRIVTVRHSNSARPPSPMFAGQLLSTSIADSRITRPTTRYVGRVLPFTAQAADRGALVVQPAHWPLVLMLVLTQAGIGLLGCAGILPAAAAQALNLSGATLFSAGMAAAVCHLGQPLKAWRFFLGLKTSWLSREILAFSLFSPIPVVLATLPWLPDFPLKSAVSALAHWALLPLGLLAIFTSVMIYHDTQRTLWRVSRGAIRFFGTALLFLSLALGIHHPVVVPVFAGLLMAKLVWEAVLLRQVHADSWSADVHSARLLLGPLRKVLVARAGLAVLALGLGFSNPWLALPVLLFAELAERQLFFQSVHAPKMPGNFGPQPARH